MSQAESIPSGVTQQQQHMEKQWDRPSSPWQLQYMIIVFQKIHNIVGCKQGRSAFM